MEDGETNETDTEGEEDNSTDSLFERTNKATARLEEANKKTEDLLNRQEDLYEKQQLGGHTQAGQEQPKPVSEDQKKTNQASEFFKNTALGDAIKKTNE